MPNLETILLVVGVLVLLDVHFRVRAIAARLDRLLASQRPAEPLSEEPSAEVLALAVAGRKIDAMRLYRAQSGADVKRARKVVDAAAAGMPAPP